MFGLLLRAIVVAIVGISLSACGTQPKPAPDVLQVYDIRSLSVTGNTGITQKLILGVQKRLDRSIQDTVRPAPLPQALMNVNVVGTQRMEGYDGFRSETQVSVTLTDPATGQPLQPRGYLVYSFSISERDADDSAAEAIAARLRAEYSLSQPTIRKASSPRVSTQMNDTTLVPIEANTTLPVVVPLKTAPALGADQDPLLNSKTKVAPDATMAGPILNQKKVNDTSKVAVDDGAKAKVVFKTKPALPAADEPCVETMDKKC
jgi:hypothetical protein